MGQTNLFNKITKLAKHLKYNSSLQKFNDVIDWEIFRDDLEPMYKYKQGKGGRPAYDPIMMLKILFLQVLYNLSDEQMEFQLLDRRSFQEFIGVCEYDLIPDARTIWVFKERLREEKLDKILFDKINYYIKKNKCIIRSGFIIDASIVEVPVQHNSKEENDQLQKGIIPEKWKEKPSKLAQKDIQASFTKKHNKSYYGYKHHIIVDEKTKLIHDYEVTTAKVHDSVVAPELLEELPKNSKIIADSAYHSDEIRYIIKKKNLDAKICAKGNRFHKLTQEEKKFNTEISKSRARIEHVFADIRSFGGNFIRRVGFERVKFQLFLVSFTYNLRRFRYLLST